MSMLETLNFLVTSSLFLTLPVWEGNLCSYPALNSGGKTRHTAP